MSAEDAQDEFAGSGGSEFDDDFGLDDDPASSGGGSDGTGSAGGDSTGGGFNDDDNDSNDLLPDEPGESTTVVGGDFRGNPSDDATVIDRDDGIDDQPVGDPMPDGAEDITEVDPNLQDDAGGPEAAQDAAAGDRGDQIRNELGQRTTVDRALEDDPGTAEAGQDALAAGRLGDPTIEPLDDPAEGASDLAATGMLASQQRRSISRGDVRASVNRFGQQQLDRESNELVGGTSAPEEAVRDLDQAGRELSEELGEGVAGLTNPQIDTSGFDDIAQDISEGRAPRADEPVLDAQPQEAPDNTGRNVAQVGGQATGQVLFGTVPAAGVAAIEGGEGAAALFGGVQRDVGELFNGDIDADQTQQAAERVQRAGAFAFEQDVAQPARRTFETNPDAFSEVARQGRADEPLVSVEEGRRDEVSGALIGAAAGSAAAAPATTAVSPLRVTRFDVPTEDGGATTVRAVRTRVPGVEDRTVATTVGSRPTVGAGGVDLRRVDLTRLGGSEQRGDLFEPVRGFETEITDRSAQLLPNDQPSERFSAISGAMDVGSEATNDVQDLRGAVANTRDLPDNTDPDEVIDALSDVDATVFGSGAVRAQAPDFRDPGDLDIVVPDKNAAKSRLADVVGEDEVQRAFDIKEPDDFAGLEEGEAFGFGQTSRAPIQTDEGVFVNPIGEELQRKAGASGFVRGETVGPSEIDVGPRPDPGGQLRIKDPEDALAIARAVAGDDDPRVQAFERAFFGSDGEADVDSETLTAGLRQFLRDDRGQVQVGRQRPTRTFDDDVTSPELDTDGAERRLDDFFGDDDVSSSPVLGDADGSSRLPILSAGAGSTGVASGVTSGFGSGASLGAGSAVSSRVSTAAGVSSGATSSLLGGVTDSVATSSFVGSGAPASPALAGSPIFASESPATSSPSSGVVTSSSPSISTTPGQAPLPQSPQPSGRQPRREEEEDQDQDDESLFAPFGADETFGTGIFTPGEDDPDFSVF